MAKSDATSEGGNPLRDELASVAASLRAYLEWQQDTGAMGIPRKPRTAAAQPSAMAAPGAAGADAAAVAVAPAPAVAPA
ncbi:MAG: Uracil-DNA glycosylase, family 4, partial [Labilithrix sp.]|nr:Uracil-DNA glycosylase, family 4 [Labilithrix sp.]